MFSTISRQSTAKPRKYVKDAVSKLPITVNRIEKLLPVRFLLSFLFSQILKNDTFFLGHIALSQPVLKIMSSNSPDKLILIP